MRKRRAISEPGQPPSSHVGLVKQFLFFVYEPAKKGVVIGPALLNKPEPDALRGRAAFGAVHGRAPMGRGAVTAENR